MARQKSNRLAASGSSSGVGVKRSASGTAAGSSNSTTVKLMEDLAHYKMPKLEQMPSVKVESGLEEADQKPPHCAPPSAAEFDYLENLTRRVPSVNHHRGAGAVDSSELDSDDDPQTTGATSSCVNDDNSDAESVDSELDNPLKHAGTYSAEEVVRIMREKLIRLQKLYIDQFQRLRYLLKEEGRKYKQGVLAEKEAELSSIHAQAKTTLEDVLAYDKIKALNHYQRPQGLESVLHNAFLERRAKLGDQNITPGASNNISGTAATPGSSSTATTAPSAVALPKCSFHITSSTKCGETVVPLSKFCLKHILEDPGQVLFRACGHLAVTGQAGDHDNVDASGPLDDGPCETPIADLLEGATCVYHTQFQTPFSTSHEPQSDNKALAADVKVDVKEAGLDATGDAAQLSGTKTTSSTTTSNLPKGDDIKMETDPV